MCVVVFAGAGCTSVLPPSSSHAFGTSVSVQTGETTLFSDGLQMTLVSIDDSRCKEGVVCVWAGELSPVLTLTGGTLTQASSVRLGTTSAPVMRAGGYDLTLIASTDTEATIQVDLASSNEPIEGTSYRDLLRGVSVQPHDVLINPLTITGEARGNWFFEASFPVRILDANGKELFAGPAQARGDWMTTEFVPFTLTATFSPPTTATGTLVLQKDNPSGLPEHDDAFEIPIRFR